MNCVGGRQRRCKLLLLGRGRSRLSQRQQRHDRSSWSSCDCCQRGSGIFRNPAMPSVSIHEYLLGSILLYLAVLSFLNGLLERLQIVFRFLCRLDHSCVHHVDLLHQVPLQVFILFSHPDCPRHRAVWCLDSLVSVIVLPRSNDGSIKYFEFVDQPMLIIEDGDP
jgi:hypothetical protein